MKSMILGACIGTTFAAFSIAAYAQSAEPYPTKAVRLIVYTPAGAPPDVVARLISEKLGASLGQPVLVENRPGAAGTIGLNAVAKARPDGYTLGVLGFQTIVAPSLVAKMPYDTAKDLAGVTLVARQSLLLVVPNGSPAKSVAELVAIAKAKPGYLKFSSGGNGSPAHLAGELFRREVGIDITHIPYKDPAGGASALLAGDVDMMFGATVAVSPLIKAAKLRPLATPGARRIPAYPEIPTMVELGFANAEVSVPQGFVVPAGTPREIVNRLHLEIQKVAAAPETLQRLQALGMEPANAGPDEFSAQIQSEVQRWARVVREAGIKPD